MPTLSAERLAASQRSISAIQSGLNKTLLGQTEVVEQVLVALLAGGHLLLEGVPGLGKTLLVRALAQSFNLSFGRVQFTPDLMPSDVTGHALFDPERQRFKIRRGPIFTHFLLADEINRAPAKTQAALLEVMAEQQVTIEGRSYPLDGPFMVLATQNPIEQEGTYPLPEAELDRFMLKVRIDYPELEAERSLVRQLCSKDSDLEAGLSPLLNAQELLTLRALCREIVVDEAVLDYALRLVRTTRAWPGLVRGAGPRASIALVQSAQALALLDGQGFITPDHIKRMVKPVLRHRILLSAEREIEGVDHDQLLQELLDQVEAPRQ